MYIPSWGDSAITGNAKIDAEHRQLYLQVDRLLAAMNRNQDEGAVREILRFLSDHVRSHFREEERLHRMVEAPGFDEHAAAHRRLTDELEAVSRRFGQEGYTTGLELHLINAVIRGFVEQVHDYDIPLAQFIQEMQRDMLAGSGNNQN